VFVAAMVFLRGSAHVPVTAHKMNDRRAGATFTNCIQAAIIK
jgi:hypothetical protein